MAVDRQKVLGALKTLRIPPDTCWGTPAEFIERLQEILIPEFSVDRNNDFVVIGHETPGEDDKNRFWIRLARNGAFLGFYLFQNGCWKRVHNYRSDEIIWMYGDSRDIPEGFQLIDGNAGGITSDVQEHIIRQYQANSSTSTPGNTVYSYFAVRWIGF